MSPKTTIYLSLLFVCFIFKSNTLDGQNKEKQDAPKTLGVSVSPSHFHFTHVGVERYVTVTMVYFYPVSIS